MYIGQGVPHVHMGGGYHMYIGEGGGVPDVHFWAEIVNRAGVPSAEGSHAA